ncbi:MAG: sigma-54 dependent transcriptional regulator [Deltaproteobacteria bacterium]|jgi:DNA-binding NtrC family response regulator|nr:sigma-54 dependent transcriptional regulator [Deltaproteobacteria bacterium]
MSLPPHILIVDDEEHIRKIMSIMLGKKGYVCKTAASGEEALALMDRESFEAVLTDLHMPGLDGLGLLAKIKQTAPELVVIVVTAFATLETAILAMKAGAYDYIAKPFNEDEMVLVLEKALERTRLLAENRRLKKEMGERLDSTVFLGQSQVMKTVFSLISKAAESKATVLITGESGTGKELAAQSIHRNGPRRDKPFVAVNCGAIPANLMESEFFGHTKGAFTGADRAKEGLISESDGGTLFLDEVTELPLETQVKFLRVLQEEEVRRVGENTPRRVDLRVLAATNRNLPEEVREGRFREDLFYRLNVIRLHMPPLRDRREDIPALAVHFLAEAVKKNSLSPKTLSPAALKLLAAQTYSGNVRALRNILEQAAVMSDGQVIGPEDLPFGPELAPAAPGGLAVRLPEDWTDLKQAAREVLKITEATMIKRALAISAGNQSRAAAALGLSRRALINKIQAYSLGSGQKGPAPGY